jgi:predicted dehydrogenase
MREIGVGLIGTGFMGRAHAFAYRAVPGIFPGSLRPALQAVADVDGAAAENAARRFGFRRAMTDWRALVADPEVEIVSVTAPNRCIARWRWRRSPRASTSTAKNRWRRRPRKRGR